MRKQYEEEFNDFNNTAWFIKIFLSEPIPPKTVDVGKGGLSLALINQGEIVETIGISATKMVYKLHGRGGDLRLVIMQDGAYFTVLYPLTNGDHVYAKVVPGLIVHKVNGE